MPQTRPVLLEHPAWRAQLELLVWQAYPGACPLGRPRLNNDQEPVRLGQAQPELLGPELVPVLGLVRALEWWERVRLA